MYGSAVRGLFMMFHLQQSADDFVHINALKDLGYKGQGDGTRWKAWELAEEDPRRKEDGGRSGYWRLTDPGIAFLANELEIWKYIWTYNNAVIKYSGPPYMTMQTVSVVEALGKNFHYGKMLAGEF
jgi:hypothetical protein